MNRAKDALSVVICTKDRPEDLRVTLESIGRQTRPADEILIVDASSDERVKSCVAAWRKESGFEKILYFSSTPGLTRQRNIGVEKSQGDVVCFLDDDVVLEPEYFKEVQHTFEDPAVYGVSGLDVNASLGGPAGRLFRRLFMLPRMDGSGRMQASGFPAWCTFPKGKIHVEILRGHNMSYRREVLERLKFNEDLEGYGLMEDAEFSYRASRHRLMVMVPTARLLHKKSPAGRENFRAIFRMRAVNHRRIYTSIHRGTWTFPFYLWSNVGVLIWSILTDMNRCGAGAFRGYLEGMAEIIRPRRH